MRWLIGALAVAVAAGAAATALLVIRTGSDEPVSLPEDAMPGRLLVGFQDDASLRWASDRAELLDEVAGTQAAVIRTIVVWAQVAPERPASPESPFDPAYQLDDLDDLARSAQQRGVELLLTIWGTPEWANGGLGPNAAPSDSAELEAFAFALADRYSGRHPGYPAVRLFTAWNEPNLEQFLAPQFDGSGASVSPGLYAEIARAVYDGVKRANPDALVAVGETSPRGHDVPSRGRVQDSHSPARFARLLAEATPDLRFDAWAQHPYPPRPSVAPADPVRWPRVGLSNLERFGAALDEWFGRDEIPLWITEYGHETMPDPLGISTELQAQFVADALGLAAGNPRIRMLLWFIVKDRAETPWQSGVIAVDGAPKPALTSFREAASSLNARNPVLPEGSDVARLPVLELAFHTPAGHPIEVSVEGMPATQVLLGPDGWLEIPLTDAAAATLAVSAADPAGHVVERVVELESGSIEAD
jgi:Cellulase (glycosyl hydrolase family 5)